jgi:hypothetical protein
MSLRLAGARNAGLDETTLAEVERRDESRLTARHRAALRVADAVITQPARIDEELRLFALEHLSAAELVEMLFDVVGWSQQKVLVALELDAPVDPRGLTELDFDAGGHAVVDGAVR